MNYTPDAIIVGSGAGGSTAARVLTERGFNVIIFEKGPNPLSEDFLPYDELHFKIHEKLTPSAQFDPDVYHTNNSDKKTRRWWTANMVGGSTRIWDANFPRYTKEDMAMFTLMKDKIPTGASVVDWPWSYDEFIPYFEKAEHEWGVSGRVRQSPMQEPHRLGYDYPMPPIRPHASTPFLIEIFNKQGWFPYLGAKAINSQTYKGRPGAVFSGFLANYGDPVNDRASASNTMLPMAINTGNCKILTNHCVTKFEFEDGKIIGIKYKKQHGNEEFFMKSNIVIVSIQAIQSARMFLISKIPDPNNLIGHYLTYHTKGSVTARFKYKPVWDGSNNSMFQPRTGIGSLEIRDLYWINDDSTNLTKGGKFACFDPYSTSTPIELVSRINKWGSELIDELNLLRKQGGVGFSFTGEAMPLYENRVELDLNTKDEWGLPVAKTFYKHHEYDIELCKYALNKLADILTKSGADITGFVSQNKENPGYGHNHGTLRAGKNPKLSVLNPNCKSHEVKGLYVLDCAFMPTSGASNPTLTLIANAYRVCEKIPKPKLNGK